LRRRTEALDDEGVVLVEGQVVRARHDAGGDAGATEVAGERGSFGKRLEIGGRLLVVAPGNGESPVAGLDARTGEEGADGLDAVGVGQSLGFADVEDNRIEAGGGGEVDGFGEGQSLDADGAGGERLLHGSSLVRRPGRGPKSP